MKNLKLVMINDCSDVGSTILRYMPAEIEKQHIKRTRGFWSKTFGISYKILRTKGDVYHSNFLLQDCYIALRLGKKPMLGWGLGTDIRSDLGRGFLGRVVRHNLKHCTRVMVSTPDLLKPARKYREDVEYFPPAVDAGFYYPKPPKDHEGKKNVLIASNVNWDVKGTDIAIRALSKNQDQFNVSIIQYGSDFEKTLALASSLHLPMTVLPIASHEQMREYYWSSDIIVDQFKCGCAGMVTLEAIACGRPAITYVASEYEGYEEFPGKDLKTEEEVAEAILKADKSLWKKEYDYVTKKHNPEAAVKKLLSIYNSMMQQ